MSLGSRILKRGRAALSANLASTPREPLLFLYPQWVRYLSTAAEASSGQHGGLPVGHTQPNIPRQRLPQNPASASDNEVLLQQRFDKPKAKSLVGSSNPDAPTTNTRIEALLKVGGDFPSIAKENSSPEKNPSVLRRQIRKILQSEENARKSAIADRRIRNAYQNFRREQLRTWIPDWRVILADLIKHTPKHGKWLDQALELVIPVESIPQLVHGIDDYILDIGYQYGVSIRVAERDEGEHEHRRFILSGPATAISKTTADVLRIAPKTEMKTASILMPPYTNHISLEVSLNEEACLIAESDESKVDITYALLDSRTPKLKMPPEQIPRPKTWTHTSFLDYIRVLTKSSVPNHLNRFGFRSGQDHTTAVTEIIRNLFADPECKPVISRTACNEALRYLVSINRFKDVRGLFVRMEMLKLPMVPETFNIMLRGTAKNEDLHNFHFILHLMFKRGLVPNGHTWIAFMMAHPDLRVKLHILRAMKDKGLTAHPSMTKEVVQQLIQPEIDFSLDQNLTQAQFVAHMDSRYGAHWLSLDSANRVLHSLGARGLISRCWQFLHFMDSRFIQYDNYSINTILQHCKQATNLTGAVELLRSLPNKGTFDFVPDEETYRILFELAWRSRSYNLARVIWRYACLSAATTHMMRSHVFVSMLYTSGQGSRATPRERWKQFAGPVIFGANHHGYHPVHMWARMNPAMNISKSTVDETHQEAKELSESLAKATDAVPTDTESSRRVVTRGEGKLAGASKEQVTGMEATTGKFELSKDAKTTSFNSNLANFDSADTQYHEMQLGLSEVKNSTVEAAEMADMGRTPSEGNDIHGHKLEELSKKVTPTDTLHPKECLDQSQIQLLKKTKGDLKLKLLLDLELFKYWRPTKPFTELLVEALERDTQWRENGDYAEMDMQSLIRSAVSVPIVMKEGYVGPGKHEWE
jgi:pentatricopeptide repeat protein